MKPLRYAAQAAFAIITLGLIGYFSASPPYARVPPEKALIKLSFAHAAEKKGGCRELSADELARLAPNMRRKTICSRERLPVDIEVMLDGAPLYAERLPPTGLSDDGPSRAYERFVVPAGEHEIVLRLRDTDRTDGYDHEAVRKVTLAAGESLAIDFFQGGFRFE
ncbi:conserved hypothetical protein [uncultured Defluviicoccus sp.]|uniref:Uncharacterized protein n=1 Tax=metagenome TaxID=256318 RepID=A0A380TAY5_9ZZZZ|nr:conserved hypothetical protein [uncultured Defluviicoccus sp.]